MNKDNKVVKVYINIYVKYIYVNRHIGIINQTAK